MTGNIVMGANKVTSTATPTTDDDLTRKGYVDSILGSATSAAASAAAAATSASNAATSASNASTSASNAASSASAAAASYDSFDDRYLGVKSSDPTLDNDGAALLTGALYFNSTAGEMRVYNGTAWVAAYLPAAAYMDLTSNQTAAGVKTFSSNPILSGGTANGVAYLNGSKVLTTGSALTFDGTNLSVGGSNSQQRLNVVVPVFTTNASGGMRIGDSANNYYVDQLVTTDGSANPFWDVKFATHTLSRYAYGGGNNFWAWYANNSEAMRLTSTSLYTASGINVGIGTSSPGYKLDVAGTVNVVNGSNGRINIGATNNYLYGDSSGNFIVGTSGSDKLLLNSSGNLGLGVTPSAFGAGRWMQFLSVSAVGQQQNGTANLACNAYESSANSFNYILSAAAARYNVTAGAHQWYTAPSGTAGNAISFTQAMTLDASGNLGVGATSPGTNLHIGTGSSPENLGVTLSRGATTNFYLAHDGTKTFIAGIDPTLDGPKVGSLNSYPLLFVTGNSERARITSGGNFGIGVSAPSTRLDIGGGQVLSFGAVEYGLTGNFGYPGISGGAGNLLFANKNYGAAAVGLGFVNSGTYEASLTVRTSGNVGIGTTNPNSRLDVDANTAANTTVLSLTNSANWGWGIFLDFRTPLTNGGAVGLAGRISSLYESSNNYALAFGTTGSGTNTERARITSGGNLLVGTTTDPGGSGKVVDSNGNVRAIPQSGSAKTSSYTLATGDVGEYISVGSGGSITIPDATFATGDVVSIFNNTTGNITITCSVTTAYIAGTDSDKATMTLATRGVATVLFISSTVCVVTGNVT
jgi:hypothetical protein